MLRRRSTPALLLLVLLVAAGLPVLTASAATVERLAGSGRYETAAAVSASYFEAGVPVAYVATGLSFPDALAGGAAAAATDGPVLLVDRDAVPDATQGELERLRPGRIVVLGGESAVSAGVLAALGAFTDGEVSRLSGADRYATAAAISAATFAPGVRDVHITTGAGFADALAAGPAAAAQESPVLLVAPGAVPAATAAELRRLQPGAITVLGGATAVWPAVEAALEQYAPVTRIFGPDRSATSAAVARAAFPDRVPAVFLAAGGAFPDALAGGPVAALTPGPLMLVPKDCVPAVVQAQIDRLAPERVVVLGGTAAVGNGVTSGTPCPGTAEVEPASVAGGPASTFVVEAPDYASEVHGDPWDYANAEDIHVGTPQMSDGGSVSGGLLSYRTATAFPWMDPVPYLPGSMPLERDGPRAPIDTARYTHLSVRMSASQAGAGILVWSTCDWSRSSSCQGAKGLAVKAGWHTYDVLLEGTDPNLRAPWSGSALQLRFIPNDKTDVDVAVDWMRLHGAAAPVRFSLEPAAPGAANEVLWDSDGDLANNTAGAPGWGVLGTTSSAAYDFPVATFPPGRYRLYTRASGRTGAYTEALHVLPRPRAVVDSPSLRSGDDYAAVVRGNAWDFDGLDDVGRNENVCNSRILAGGVLAANNCGAEIDNPYFFLPTAGAIDGSTFHRLHLRLRYDGPFGLTGGPTGGAVARLIWYVASDGAASDQNVHDIVVYPGWQDIAVDLRTDPPSAVVDESQSGRLIGWAGQTITSLRLDPNEDVSSRQWYVDSVRLTREDAARGAYDVRFRETSGLGGTAQVFLDRDRSGTDGLQVASQPVVAGANAARIALPASLPEGRYWPYVVVTGPSGSTVEYAASPVHLTR